MPTYISVPNTFASGTTFIVGQFNNNYSALVDGLSDGTKDLNVKNIDGTTLVATSTLAVASDTACQLTLAVTNTATMSAVVQCNAVTNMNIIELGVYVSSTISASKSLTVQQTYTTIKTSTQLEIETIVDVLADNTLLILKKDPASVASPVIKNTSTIILGADRTLSSVNDVLVLRKQSSKWFELSYNDNA